MTGFPNINYCWGGLIAEELLRLGVEYFCLAPGSRCAPLTVAIGRNPKARTFVHFDERGLAFHALGYVSATRKPAVLVCTSGTAVANFLPAVVEASKKKLPLIVLTADRPPELRQTGAVQTIDQPGIFGKYALWQTDMPCPDLKIRPEFVLTTIDQAVHQACHNRGVVHVNCMFREPLAPVAIKTVWGDYFAGLKSWQKSAKPYTQYEAASAGTLSDPKALAGRINAFKKGIVVVGKVEPDDHAAILAFARRLGWPVFADISSGLRLGQKNSQVIHYFDQLLLDERTRRSLDDCAIVHLGGRITSKRYYEFLQAKSPSEYIVVLNHALRNDPAHKVTLRVQATVKVFCDGLTGFLKPGKGAFYKELAKANAALDKAVHTFLSEGRLSEPAAARLISQLAPADTGLFLANSMPIRDMDMYGDFKGAAVAVAGNRGASGIDGLVASACGYAQGLQKPVTLAVGDLAALHDLNSLAMLKDCPQPVIIIVFNNGGGGIFSFLPIAEHRDVFEKFFGTPHPFTFANAAAMFELNYHQPYEAKGFAKAYTQAFKSRTSTIIEVVTSREENLKVHRELQRTGL